MTENLLLLLFCLIIGIILGFLIAKLAQATLIREARKSSVTGSRAVILGEIYEKILPVLPDFPYAPKDMTFLGKGVDYIIFDGMSEGDLREIVFLELKSGNARLNKNEQMIRDCLDRKKVRFSEYRIMNKRTN